MLGFIGQRLCHPFWLGQYYDSNVVCLEVSVSQSKLTPRHGNTPFLTWGERNALYVNQRRVQHEVGKTWGRYGHHVGVQLVCTSDHKECMYESWHCAMRTMFVHRVLALSHGIVAYRPNLHLLLHQPPRHRGHFACLKSSCTGCSLRSHGEGGVYGRVVSQGGHLGCVVLRGRWDGTVRNGSWSWMTGTCVTFVNCARYGTMTWREQ